jgi:hypothetical protein
VANALTFTSATCVVNWREDWVVGQFVGNDSSSMWLFARANGGTAGSFRVGDDTVVERLRSTLRSAGYTSQESRLTVAQNRRKDVHPRRMCVIEILGEILDSHPEGERWNKVYRN